MNVTAKVVNSLIFIGPVSQGQLLYIENKTSTPSVFTTCIGASIEVFSESCTNL